MAYIKTKTLRNGFSASYWRVTSIEANKLSKDVEVIVHGYKDKATRQDGATPIIYLKYSIPVAELDFSKDLFEQAYVYIRDKKDGIGFQNPNAEAFFADAEVD